MRIKRALFSILFGICLIPINSFGDTINKPYTFTSGTPAKAGEVNADFDALYNQVNKMGGVIDIDAANQRVGIGTTSPGEKLSVNGKIQSVTGGFKFPDGTVQTTAFTGSIPSSNALDAADGEPPNAVYVDADGNVGINTTGPSCKLDVNGTVKATSFFGEGSGLTDLPNGYALDAADGEPADILYVNNSGNIGIKTTNSTLPLEVHWVENCISPAYTPGTVAAFVSNADGGNWSSIALISGDNGRSTINFGDVDDEDIGSIHYSNISDTMWFTVNGDYRMFIDSSGNVGIGTTEPQGTLDVNGSIYQSGGVLHADYVFEPDYELESIEDHAEFMWRNKHLKAMPKKKTEKGKDVVEIGDHRRGIVEELEKAHIYIEQLNKKNKDLEKRIAKLEALLAQK